jgi:hypothetical protein
MDWKEAWQERMERGHGLAGEASEASEAGDHARAADLFTQAAECYRSASLGAPPPDRVQATPRGKPRGPAPTRSQGHIGYHDGYEYFRLSFGDVYRAPEGGVVDRETRVRPGAEFVALGHERHFLSHRSDDRFPF